MSVDATTGSERDPVPLWTLARRGFTAASVAVIANVVVVLGADAVGIAPGLAPLAIGPVVWWTVAGVAGATAVYGVLDRLASAPGRTFRRVAALVLLLSFVPDAMYAPTLPGATATGVLTLALLHVVTAAVAVWLLPSDTTPRWLGGDG